MFHFFFFFSENWSSCKNLGVISSLELACLMRNVFILKTWSILRRIVFCLFKRQFESLELWRSFSFCMIPKKCTKKSYAHDEEVILHHMKASHETCVLLFGDVYIIDPRNEGFLVKTFDYQFWCRLQAFLYPFCFEKSKRYKK